MKPNGYKKKCTKCGRYKHIKEFHKRKHVNPLPKYICSGCDMTIQMQSTVSWCKKCGKKQDEEFNKSHPEYRKDRYKQMQSNIDMRKEGEG